MLKHIKNKGEIFSWCMFDFANSSFTTIIITIVFSVYFTKFVAGGSGKADQLWGFANTLSQGAVLLSAPLFGAIADYSASKKKFLLLSYITCIFFTGLLTLIAPGQVWLAMVLFVIGNFAYSTGENLIASFLPEIAQPEDMGKISGFGWALGYMGGLTCLVICLPFLKGGFVPENVWNLRLTNIVVAVFFLIAGLPTFLWVKERKAASTLPPEHSYFSIGVQRIRETFHEIRHFRELFKFLILFGIYNCGVTIVVYFASIYAVNTIHLTPEELIWFFLITQVSSSIGAFFFGLLQDRLGTKNTLWITLSLWLSVAIIAYLTNNKMTFFVVGNLAGLGLGSSQSAARALVGLFSPIDKTAEFFGFWGLFWKLSTAVGPLVFGTISRYTENQRFAILVTGMFFVIGMIGLFFIDEKKGREAALSYRT